MQIEWLDKDDHHSMYVKYALMELSCTDEIDFIKIHPAHYEQSLLSKEKQKELRPSQSFFVARKGRKKCKVVIDCSESYLFISPVLSESDLYFCSSYTERMFREHTLFEPYSWQKKYDLQSYQDHFDRINKQFGDSFHKIRPSIPLPMVMDIQAQLYNSIYQVYIISLVLGRKMKKRMARYVVSPRDPELLLLRMRFDQLKAYRENDLQYDIVLRDALWGWPHHRLKLHQAIRGLSSRCNYTSLSVPDPDDIDAKWRHFIPKCEINEAVAILKEKVDFPRPYEEMLASSRLSVFATGKHWGSRMIAFISLLCGGPLMMDRPIYEPYFPMTHFDIDYLKNDWSEMSEILDQIDHDKWYELRKFNQTVFDKYLAPIPVARYLCETIDAWFENHSYDS